MYRVVLPLLNYLSFQHPVAKAFLGGKSSLPLAKLLIAPDPGIGKIALNSLYPYTFRKVSPDAKPSASN